MLPITLSESQLEYNWNKSFLNCPSVVWMVVMVVVMMVVMMVVMVVVNMVVMMVVMMVPIPGEQEHGSLCSWAPIAEGTPAQVGIILKQFLPPYLSPL